MPGPFRAHVLNQPVKQEPELQTHHVFLSILQGWHRAERGHPKQSRGAFLQMLKVYRWLLIVIHSSPCRNYTGKKSSRLSSLQWDGQKTPFILIQSSRLEPQQVSKVAHGTCIFSVGKFILPLPILKGWLPVGLLVFVISSRKQRLFCISKKRSS